MSDKKEQLVRPKHVRLSEFRETPGKGGKSAGSFDLRVSPPEVVDSWMESLARGFDALREASAESSMNHLRVSPEGLTVGVNASEIVVRQDDHSASSATKPVRIQLRDFGGSSAVVTLCLDPKDEKAGKAEASATLKFPYRAPGKSPDNQTKKAIEQTRASVWAALPEIATKALDKKLGNITEPSKEQDGQPQAEEVVVFEVREKKAPLSIGEIVYRGERASLNLSSPSPEDAKEWREQVAGWKGQVNQGLKAVEYDHLPEASKGEDNKRHPDEKFQVGLDWRDKLFIRLTHFAGTDNAVILRFGEGSITASFPWTGEDDRSKVKTRDEVQRTSANQWKRLLDHVSRKMQKYAQLESHTTPSQPPAKRRPSYDAFGSIGGGDRRADYSW